MDKKQLILWILGTLMERLTADDIRKWVGWALQLIEAKVKESPNKYDDIIVLPIIDICRKQFEIPEVE